MVFRSLATVFLILLAAGCASSRPPGSPAKADRPPLLSGTTGAPAASGEPEPFYEGTTDTALVEEEMKAEALERVIGEEAEEEIERSTAAPSEVPQFDIPIVINARVEKWITYFQTSARKVFKAWLERSARYIPMFKRILRENGLPEDLIYLAMIESGFKPYAYSRARASGPWQFIKGTGRLYGLKVTPWIDERRDPEKSTIAAAQHLKDLYDQFNCWYLAAAGYNAGAGKISKAIRRYSTEDFWEMSGSQYRYLRHETKNYVPKLIAAALMAKDPARFGFTDLQYEDPLEYDKVLVPQPTELRVISETLSLDPAVLKDLNPELTHGITPPDTPNYELKIPVGQKEPFVAAYPGMRKKSVSRIARHVVERGENLSKIAAAYGVSVQAIQSFNQLKGTRLRPGQQLAIPYRGMKVEEPVRVASYQPPRGAKASRYEVRQGDTLWSISRRFDVTVGQIRQWNRLRRGRDIYPGQSLALYAQVDPSYIGPPRESPTRPLPPEIASPLENGWKTHQVRKGDTLWGIARQYGVSVDDLSKWNRLPDANIKPGTGLKVRSVGL